MAGFFTASLSFGVFPAFWTTVSSGLIVFSLPSGYVISTVPSAPTTTSLALGLVFLTFSFTLAFSSSVSFLLSSTSTLAFGLTAGFSLASVSFSFAFSTKSVFLIVSLLPSLYVIVAVPSLATSTVVFSGKLSLFACLIFSLTSAISLSSSDDGFATFTFSAGTFGVISSANVLT